VHEKKHIDDRKSKKATKETLGKRQGRGITKHKRESKHKEKGRKIAWNHDLHEHEWRTGNKKEGAVKNPESRKIQGGWGRNKNERTPRRVN